MSRVYVKTYDPFSITGKDFPTVGDTHTQRRILFSPENKHVVSLNFLRDGMLLFSNESRADFQFTIGRNSRSMAVVKFKYSDEGELLINNNFRVSKAGVRNREIHENPNTMISNTLHINVSGVGIGRVDLKVDESGFAACVFSDIQLMFVRMNGNHIVPRLNEFFQREFERTDLSVEKVRTYVRDNPLFAREVAKKFISDWLNANDVMDEADFIQKIAEFLRVSRSLDWNSIFF